MSVANRLIDAVIAREGGYSNHPSDRGGPTNFGITQETARRYGYTGDMQEMPRAKAVEIYYARYWAPFSKVAERSEPLAEHLFDIGVNMGVMWGGVFLQRALNLFNARGKHYADIKVDGDVGPATLRAMDALIQRRGVDAKRVLVSAVICQKGDRYIDIIDANQTQEDFAFGWFLHRIAALIGD